jgi:hypothetical protein
MSGQITATIVELDSRVNDGIHVRLLWGERDARLAVTVSDSKTCEAFVLEVREGERALDVFHHPYAYAAWHGLELGAAVGARSAGVSVPAPVTPAAVAA